MMSREKILSIEQYCSAHNVTHKQRLAELNIPFWKFYRAKQRYRNQDEAGKDGGFVQLVPGGPFQPAAMPAPRTSGRSRSGNSSKVEACESYLSVEMRKSFCGLQGIATNELESRVADGDVFIFVNKNRNKMKILAS